MCTVLIALEKFTSYPCFWGTFLAVSSAFMLLLIAGKRRDDEPMMQRKNPKSTSAL
jgi:hypothetical protein